MGIITDTLNGMAAHFERVNVAGLSFDAECFFAEQQIQRNKYTGEVATKNPDSLADAILSVGAVGLTLSPAHALCYLVPRDGKIALDISYRGLVRLATDAGSILMAKPVLVYEGDKFAWRGPAEMPVHEADVFSPARSDSQQPLKGLIGGYCAAWLPGGAVMVDIMSVAEIMAVKNASKSDKGPWAGAWAGEMAKKTLIKRASKSWPTTPTSARLDAAISAGDEAENVESPAHAPAPNSAPLDFSEPEPDPAAHQQALASARRPVAPDPEPPQATVTPPPKSAAVLLGATGAVCGQYGSVAEWLDAFDAMMESTASVSWPALLRNNDPVFQKIQAKAVFDQRIERIKHHVATAAAMTANDDVPF